MNALTILIIIAGHALIAWVSYDLGHTIGYDRAYWERTEQIDRLLGRAD